MLVLGEDASADDLARAGARKRQAGVEASLDLGEVLARHGGDLVDGLLTRHDHPHAAGALRAQVLDDGLEVEHEARVGADVLAHLVHHEQQAKLAAFLLGALAHILVDLAHEPIRCELELLGVVEPALRGLAALGARLLEGVDDGVAVEVVGVALVEPFGARDLAIRGAERLGFALLVDVALQACELEVLAVEPEVLEEHTGEDAQDGGLVLVGRALGVDVEQDGLGGDVHGAARLGLDHGVLEARRDDVDRRTPVCRLAGEQVREHLEEVRFTGAEETRDPHADLVGGGVERTLVGVEERREVPAQLVGHHVFGELLLDDLLVVLLDLDNAVDVAVDVAFEHVLDAHGMSFLGSAGPDGAARLWLDGSMDGKGVTRC